MSQDTHTNEPHVLPLSIYLGIGSILIILTAVTVYVSFIDFGPFNLMVAMIIAAVKASLVALYFMHLKYDNKLYAMFFISALFFLAVFVVITMFDTLRRDDIYEIKAESINKNAIIYDSLPVDSSTAIIDSLEVKSDSTTIVIDSTK